MRKAKVGAIVVVGILASSATMYFALFGDSNEFFAVQFGTNGACFGELVNKTEREIRFMHGEPIQQMEEYRPLGHNGEPPAGRIRTLVFQGRGGLNNRGRHNICLPCRTVARLGLF